MKSVITESSDGNFYPPSLPYLVERSDGGVILLVKQNGMAYIGTIVKVPEPNHHDYEVGYVSDWLVGFMKPFGGSVTLSND